MSEHHPEPPLTALSGPDLLQWLSSDAAVRDHVLTDGRHTVTYAETVPLLQELDRRFAAVAAAAQPHTLALECSQTTAGALALLWVLSREISVVLLPELADSAKEAGTPRFIPSFCAHVLTASASRTRTVESPLDALELTANEAYAEEPAVADFQGPDLYLRTSGSTGVPKLTRMPHQKWLDNAQACVERWQLTAEDRLSVPVPIFHSYGFGAAFLPGLLAGSAMDVGSGGNILRYIEREEQFGPNVGFLTPALCDMFLTIRKTPRLYKLAVTAGDKIKRETMAGFEPRFGPILNLYGSAEMGAVSSAAPDSPPQQRLGTAGPPLAGIELRAEETGEGLEAAEGEQVGRLLCRQKNGSVGYLSQPEPGGPWRFDPRGEDDWFETGDLARIRADGYVEVLGRSGLSVKRDGLLVVFADVEAAVEKVEGVQRAVVVGAGESRRGVRLVAVCLADQAGLQPDAVRQKCFELLPRYAVPDAVLIVDSLPHLPSGKVDRRAVRELAANG